jgi:predicted transposase YdaD
MGSSDHEFYELFKAEPRLLDIFIDMNPHATYEFDSMIFKELQRQCDGLLRSSDPDEAAIIFEFQMQRKPDIYVRIISEMAMYQSKNMKQKVRGVIVFLNPDIDPGDPNWRQVVDTCPDLLKVLYLNEIYEDLKRTKPDSPLQVVFAPFVENDLRLIRRNARKWSKQLNQLPYNQEQRETIFKVFMSWLVKNLPDISEKELIEMTSLVQDISHTRFYKEVSEKFLQEGLERGLERGIQKSLNESIQVLQEMLDEGLISKETYESKVKVLKGRTAN